MSIKKFLRFRFAFIIFLLTLVSVHGKQSYLFAQPGQCAENEYYWVGGSGNWSIAGNWKHVTWDPIIQECVWANNVPSSGAKIAITNGGTATLTNSALVTFLWVNSSTLILQSGSLAITNNTAFNNGSIFRQYGGSVSGRVTVGDEGFATFIQSNGINTLSNLTLGGKTNSSGFYKLSGSGILNANIIDIGDKGTGDFIQIGGENFSQFERIGRFGTGNYIQQGGTHTLMTLLIGEELGSEGTYKMEGGDLEVINFEAIGFFGGTGTFIQDGGTHTIVGDISIGVFHNTSGKYYLNNGVLNLGNDCWIGGDDTEGPGYFEVNGGTIKGTTVESILGVGETGRLIGPGVFNIPVSYESASVYGTTGEESFGIDFKPKSLKIGGEYTVTQLTPQDFASGEVPGLLRSSVFEVSFGGKFEEFEIDIPYVQAEVNALGITESALIVFRETGPETYECLEIVERDIDHDDISARSKKFGKFAVAANPVKRLSQSDSQWGTDGLGEPRCGCAIPRENLLKNRCIRKDDSNCLNYDGSYNQCTIASQGCVLTSATMIINSLLGTDYNPDYINAERWGDYSQFNIFNNRLLHWDGQSICVEKTNDVKWSYVEELIERISTRHHWHKSVAFTKGDTNETKKQKIAETLCKWHVPVAVRVTGHTVVAYCFESKPDGKLKIKIADPANRTKWNLGQPPKCLDEYTTRNYEIIKMDYIYPVADHGPVQPFYSSLSCPAEFVIWDPNGLRTGFDPRTGNSYNEIPGVSYWVEWPNEDLSEPNSVVLDRDIYRKSAYIEMPPGETLLFEIIGTDYGQGIFAFECSKRNGNVELLMEQAIELEPNSSELIVIELSACENTQPVADAGLDQNVPVGVDCLASVTLDGSGSSDADADVITYSWKIDGQEIATGIGPTVELPLGVHVIGLVVNDGVEDSGADEVVITVEDTIAPEISLSVEPAVLWPPNHKMVEVFSDVNVSDGCDGDVDVTVSVTSNEDDNGKGDGNRTGDIEVTDAGRIFLRAERSGTGDGRVYTIIYQAEDASGNTTQGTATVTVPHSKP